MAVGVGDGVWVAVAVLAGMGVAIVWDVGMEMEDGTAVSNDKVGNAGDDGGACVACSTTSC